MIIVEATLTAEELDEFELEAELEDEYDLELEDAVIIHVVPDPYEGSYEFTPSEEEQIIEIASKTANQNITINGIPDGYARLVWDGQKLTVY